MKKKKNRNIKKTPFVEPGTEVAGVNDEHNYQYNYGNVIEVKGVDIKKNWTEATLGQYFKDAGFVKGSGNTPRNKAEITPFFIKFASKLMSMLQKEDGKVLCLELTGNGMKDFDNAFNLIGLEQLLHPGMPPSYKRMATFLVVSAYVMGLPGFGRGSLPNIIKDTLVLEMNREIPRNYPDLIIKIQYTWNRYYGLAEQHRLVQWDTQKLAVFLQGNSIRQYSTTRYPRTQRRVDRIIALSHLVICLIIKYEKINPKDVMIKDESVESAIDNMGRLAIRYWNSRQHYAFFMKNYTLAVSLIAFQTGISHFVYPPLIDGYLKQEILNNLEFPHLRMDDGDINECFHDIYYYLNEKKKKKKKKKKTATVLVDTQKKWNEATVGQYLNNAGFIRGSGNTASNKAEITPFYIKFASKLLSIHLDNYEEMLLLGKSLEEIRNQPVKVALDFMGRMVLKYWDLEEPWTFELRIYTLVTTLAAFEKECTHYQVGTTNDIEGIFGTLANIVREK
ncbi:hypothetical protein DFA_11210 [Cavenderia fasciculata]|uniref:Uncharacterized protein n=1 Tax=Cavenderia fasciculata TaxID=261658 RepID=F4QFE2_CACFS|nr:uncharacterized protein DFA_11210 [Cavenderia fasciculata]EGG13449.1 hypothetical protein DFA_11210 [Cavenderia fasciculata]|eukprot:XP_004350153.1 hypothetical protein DFA_11210 [Cavenderia fasciculata]